MSIRYVDTAEGVRSNAVQLHRYAVGTTDERAFHRQRVSNALHHVVLSGSSGPIYAPVKWCGAMNNDIMDYGTNKEPVTDNFRRALRRLGFSQVSPGHPLHGSLYKGFVEYCSAFGFSHSRPGFDERHYHIFAAAEVGLYPEELEGEGADFWEGASKMVKVNRYERDRDARNACLAAKGLNCAVCNMNFFDRYGELGEGFIHVHHLVPIATIKETYRLNPIADLEPVCPNCHAMLHKQKPPYSPQELRQLLGMS